MIPLLDHPANTLLIRWLAQSGVAAPVLLASWETDRVTLLASPELIARMLRLAGAQRYRAIHGFPALAGEDGQVDVVCAGLATLLLRGDEPPDGLAPTRARPPFGWVALDAWQPDLPPEVARARLSEVIRAVRLR